MSLRKVVIDKRGRRQVHRGQLTVMDLPTYSDLALAGRLPQMCECSSCRRLRGEHPMAEPKEG
jgi:hypothetical protein